jgi:hypothetical protein
VDLTLYRPKTCRPRLGRSVPFGRTQVYSVCRPEKHLPPPQNFFVRTCAPSTSLPAVATLRVANSVPKLVLQTDGVSLIELQTSGALQQAMESEFCVSQHALLSKPVPDCMAMRCEGPSSECRRGGPLCLWPLQLSSAVSLTIIRSLMHKNTIMAGREVSRPISRQLETEVFKTRPKPSNPKPLVGRLLGWAHRAAYHRVSFVSIELREWRGGHVEAYNVLRYTGKQTDGL